MGYALEVEGVSKSYDEFQLSDISFHLQEGSIMGLIGTNGAGKTTLIQMILGLIKSNSGTIKIYGVDQKENEKLTKDYCGFVLDENPFIEVLSAKNNARLFGPYYSNWDMDKFLSYCKQFEVNIKKPIKKLSQGTLLKFQLAFALSHDAKLFVFDEPSAGLDPVFRRELIDIMYDIILDGTRSILFSTHLTNDLDSVADYITMIHNGKQLFTMEKDDLLDKYRLIRGSHEQIDAISSNQIVGVKHANIYSEALVYHHEQDEFNEHGKVILPTIEDIMYYMINRK